MGMGLTQLVNLDLILHFLFSLKLSYKELCLVLWKSGLGMLWFPYFLIFSHGNILLLSFSTLREYFDLLDNLGDQCDQVNVLILTESY